MNRFLDIDRKIHLVVNFALFLIDHEVNEQHEQVFNEAVLCRAGLSVQSSNGLGILLSSDGSLANMLVVQCQLVLQLLVKISIVDIRLILSKCLQQLINGQIR